MRKAYRWEGRSVLKPLPWPMNFTLMLCMEKSWQHTTCHGLQHACTLARALHTVSFGGSVVRDGCDMVADSNAACRREGARVRRAAVRLTHVSSVSGFQPSPRVLWNRARSQGDLNLLAVCSV